MRQQFSREALYELVWAEPRTRLARRLGVSDVGLAKACTYAGIPMPPRGYWSRVAAGKQVPRTALPTRALGRHDYVQVGSHDYCAMTDEEALPLPPAPVFNEPVDAVQRMAERLLARCHVSQSLHHLHPLIRTLLGEDALRRKKLLLDRYAWPKPEFDSAQALRRVRIINGLFLAVAYAGSAVSIGTKDLRTVGFRVGDTSITVKVQTIGMPAKSPSALTERIALVAECWPLPVGIPTRWQDGNALPIEKQILEIARDLLVMAEMAYRVRAVQQYTRCVERKESFERKACEERARQEREAVEHQVRQEAARRRRLMRQAANLRKADEVRELIVAMDNRLSASSDTIETQVYGEWRAWALEQADLLDPRVMPLLSVISFAKSPEEK